MLSQVAAPAAQQPEIQLTDPHQPVLSASYIANGTHRRDHGVHATNIATLADLVVSILPPTFTPRVLDNPVWLFLEADWRIAS